MPQSLARVLVHIVFSTKNRQPFLKDQSIRGELHAYLITVLALKIDFIVLPQSNFDGSRRQRRRQLSVLPDGPTWFASPEDVNPQEDGLFSGGRQRQALRDIAGVVRIQGNRLDKSYVAKWAKLLSVETVWRSILAKEQESN